MSPKGTHRRHDLGSIAVRLNTAVVHLNRRLRRNDIELGLPTAQASALTLLVSAGPHTVGDLAGYENVSGPTMTRLVTALESRGLVRRARNRADLRQVHVEATQPGKALIARGRTHRIQRLERELAALSPQEREILSEAADLLLRLVERPA